MFDFPMPWDVEAEEVERFLDEDGPPIEAISLRTCDLPPAIDPARDEAIGILYDVKNEVAQEGESPEAWLILTHAIEYLQETYPANTL